MNNLDINYSDQFSQSKNEISKIQNLYHMITFYQSYWVIYIKNTIKCLRVNTHLV